MNFKTMHQQRKLILISAAIGVIATFLPWVTFMGHGINALHGVGILAFLGFAAAVTFSLLQDQKAPLAVNFWLLTLFSGAVAALVTLIALLQVLGHPVVSISFGIFISLGASGFLVYSVWTHKQASDSIQAGFDSLFKGGQPAAKPQAQQSNPGRMAELEKLVQMRNEGKISEEEYQDLKSKIL